jgi:uncharacterized membrane protein YdbT with pleckstrin-like domain
MSPSNGISFSGQTLPFTIGDMLSTALNFVTMYGEWVVLAVAVIFSPVLYSFAVNLVSIMKRYEELKRTEKYLKEKGISYKIDER